MGHRAAVYVRVSQDRAGEGLGVERQREDCLVLAERLGWEVRDVYADNDVSAHSRKPRPEYQRLVRDIEAGEVDAVVAYRPDRAVPPHPGPREPDRPRERARGAHQHGEGRDGRSGDGSRTAGGTTARGRGGGAEPGQRCSLADGGGPADLRRQAVDGHHAEAGRHPPAARRTAGARRRHLPGGMGSDPRHAHARAVADRAARPGQGPAPHLLQLPAHRRPGRVRPLRVPAERAPEPGRGVVPVREPLLPPAAPTTSAPAAGSGSRTPRWSGRSSGGSSSSTTARRLPRCSRPQRTPVRRMRPAR